MKPILFCAALLLAVATCRGAEPKRVTISGYDTMKFDITEIVVSPGQKVIVEFKNEGVMPKEAMGHNWVLLKAGVDPIAYANAAATAKDEDYIPKSQANNVLASIRLIGPGEKATTTFTAPTVPGRYEYVCSFPIHTQAGMRGVLIVK